MKLVEVYFDDIELLEFVGIIREVRFPQSYIPRIYLISTAWI